MRKQSFAANGSLTLLFLHHFLVIMQVNFLTKLVALRPGKAVHEMIKNVMLGKDEGAADYDSGGIGGKVRFILQ